ALTTSASSGDRHSAIGDRHLAVSRQPIADSRNPLRGCLVVESGTDVRLVDGLAERFAVTVLARKIEGGVEVSRPCASPVIVGPSSRSGFASFIGKYLYRARKQIDFVLVQGYGAAALVSNAVGRLTATPTIMLVCSPTEAYY